jgi:hypothetical protein
MSDDEFFVGYLPTPPRTRRFALAVGALGAVLAAGVAALAASATAGPGEGVLPFRTGVELVGVLEAEPYGTLFVLDEADPSRVHGVLLARGGKFGMPREAAALDGQVVRVRGGLLERDGHRMLELAALPEPASLAATSEARLRSLPRVDEGEVSITGEIVDSKCFLGRMRPGGGRTHRACAQLCVAGGIPPVLVHGERHHVLVGRDGAPLDEAILPYLAEPVRVRGHATRVADLHFLEVDPTSIERL